MISYELAALYAVAAYAFGMVSGIIAMAMRKPRSIIIHGNWARIYGDLENPPPKFRHPESLREHGL
jgi:predicted short-subunit dehydrogenase-like oxidoreductase (DUF2520 family)